MKDENVTAREAESSVRPAIDTESGLRQYEGDQEVYDDVLACFARSNAETLTALKSAVCTDNISQAHRTAHSLRGAAGTIGADRLALAALATENTLASVLRGDVGSLEPVSFHRQVAALEEEFKAVFDELAPLSATPQTASPGGRTANIDRARCIALLDRLSPFLKSGDTRCLDHMGEIEEVFLPVAELFRLFAAQIEQYDFEQAYDTMEILRRFLTT